MLYIEKTACPPEVASAIEEKKASELWLSAIDPACEGLSPEEKSHAVQTLRTHFDDLDKKRIRPALLQEQHSLCAYCMTQIKDDASVTTIEHWSPLGQKKSNAIDYNNFLAVCKGGRDIAKVRGQDKVLCCDASKGEEPITIDPRNKEMMKGIEYSSDGLIKYREGTTFNQRTLQRDIDQILQLNGKTVSRRNERVDTATRLIQQRRNVYRSTEEVCLDMLDNGELNEAWLDQQIRDCLRMGNREAFAGVALYVYSLYRERLTKLSQ